MVGNNFFDLKVLDDDNTMFKNKTIHDYDYFQTVPYYDKRLTISDCLDIFKTGNTVIPIREDGEILGVVDKSTLLAKASKEKLHGYSSCSNCITKNYLYLPVDAPLNVIQRLLKTTEAVLLFDREEDGKLSKIYCINRNDILNLIEKSIKQYV